MNKAGKENTSQGVDQTKDYPLVPKYRSKSQFRGVRVSAQGQQYRGFQRGGYYQGRYGRYQNMKNLSEQKQVQPRKFTPSTAVKQVRGYFSQNQQPLSQWKANLHKHHQSVGMGLNQLSELSKNIPMQNYDVVKPETQSDKYYQLQDCLSDVNLREDQLKKNVADLRNEIQSLTFQLSQIDSQHTDDIQELRLQWEHSIREKITEKLKELTEKFEADSIDLEDEIIRLGDELEEEKVKVTKLNKKLGENSKEKSCQKEEFMQKCQIGAQINKELQEENEALKRKMEARDKEFKLMQEGYQKNVKELAQAKKKLATIDQEKKEEMDQTMKQLLSLKSKNDSVQQLNVQLTQTRQNNDTQILNLTTTNEQQNNEITNLKSNLESLTEKSEDLSALVRDLQHQNSEMKLKHQTQLEKEQSCSQEYITKYATLQNKFSSMESSFIKDQNSTVSKNEKLEANNQTLVKQISKIKKASSLREKQSSELKSELQGQVQRLQKDLSQAITRIEKGEKENQRLKFENQQLQSEVTSVTHKFQMEISDKIQRLKQKQERYIGEIKSKDQTLMMLQNLNKNKLNQIKELQSEKQYIKQSLDDSVLELTNLHKKDLEAANLQWQQQLEEILTKENAKFSEIITSRKGAVVELQRENDKLNQSVQQLENENNVLSEKTKTRETEIILLSNENGKLIESLSQNRAQITLYEGISNQLKQMTSEKLNAEEKLDNLNQTIKSEQLANDSLREEIASTKQQAMMLQLENSKILNINSNNHKEIVLYQKKIESYEASDRSAQVLENEKVKLKKELEVLIKTQKSLETQIQNLSEQNSNLKSLNSSQLQDTEFLEKEFTVQNTELQEQLSQQKSEIKNWAKKHKSLEEELQEMCGQFSTCQDLNSTLQDASFVQKSQSIESQNKIIKLQKKLEECRNVKNKENQELRAQIHRIRTKLEMKDQKMKSMERELKQENTKLQNDLSFAANKQHSYTELKLKFHSEKSHYESQLKQMQEMSENSRCEIKKLYELLNKRKLEHEENMRRIQQIKTDNDQLENENRKLNESSLLNEKSLFNDREVDELKQERDMYKEQAKRQSTELTSKNRELAFRIQEMEMLKQKYEEALTKLEELNTSLINKLMDG